MAVWGLPGCSYATLGATSLSSIQAHSVPARAGLGAHALLEHLWPHSLGATVTRLCELGESSLDGG